MTLPIATRAGIQVSTLPTFCPVCADSALPGWVEVRHVDSRQTHRIRCPHCVNAMPLRTLLVQWGAV